MNTCEVPIGTIISSKQSGGSQQDADSPLNHTDFIRVQVLSL